VLSKVPQSSSESARQFLKRQATFLADGAFPKAFAFLREDGDVFCSQLTAFFCLPPCWERVDSVLRRLRRTSSSLSLWPVVLLPGVGEQELCTPGRAYVGLL